MDLPIQPIILSLPAIIYYFVLRKKGTSKNEIAKNLGLAFSEIKYFGWGILIAVMSAALTFSITIFITPDIFENEHLSTNIYRSWTFGIGFVPLAFIRETVYTTLGEEIFFRGFLGGILIRRLGLRVGNLLQAFVFLIPHLFLLAIDISFLPFIIIITIIGWALGLLRHQSKSIIPGLLTHSLVNTFSAIQVMN